MAPKTISIHHAAQLLTEATRHIPIPRLTDGAGLEIFDEDDNRYFFQTMDHRNAIVDGIKSGKIQALDEFSLMPIGYWKDIPDTQPIRWSDFLKFAESLECSIPASGADKSTKDTTSSGVKELDPWMIRAQEHAREIWLRMLGLNKKPSKESIAQEIAGRLHNVDKMVTKTGKRITVSNIVRISLKGWEPPKPE